jgi:regulator of sigma E protease
MLIWIIIAFIIFSIVILIHEFGHFSAARKFWVKVLEFWLWLPPKSKELFTDKLWTKYTLNWLPLGWFVRLDWEENLQNRTKEKTKFYNKNYLQKSIILLAWVFMNFLLASIIFAILFFIWLKPFWVNTIIENKLNSKVIPTYSEALRDWLLIKKDWIILTPLKWSIAQKSWIKSWDILVWLKFPDKSPIKNFSLQELQKQIENYKWKNLVFCILKENKNWINTAKSINIKIPDSWKIWVYIQENIRINKDFKYKYSLIDSIKYWFKETYIQSILTLKWLKLLWQKIISPKNEKERQQALKEISWPIWIVDFIANSYQFWLQFILVITAIISVNLWVFNLLPIPALDWWRWLLLTINIIVEKLSFWKINIFYIENFIHLIFFIILIALSFFIWYNDIVNIIYK